MVNEKLINNFKKKQMTTSQRGGKILSNIIEREERNIAVKSTIGEMQSASVLNIFTKKASAEDMNAFNDLMEKSFGFGIDYGPGDNSKAAKDLSEMVVSNVNDFTSKLGEDIKKDALDIIDRGLSEGLMPYEIQRELVDNLDIRNSRAEMIARTETMRASNMASYLQAKQEGMTHFVVDNRAEACEECQDTFEGEIFPIEEIDMIPPEHPNCACVPVYFRGEEEAQAWSDDLKGDKEDIRDYITDELGKDISGDGTSQWTNDGLPEEYLTPERESIGIVKEAEPDLKLADVIDYATGMNSPLEFTAEDGSVWFAKTVTPKEAEWEMVGKEIADQLGLGTPERMFAKNTMDVDKSIIEHIKAPMGDIGQILFSEKIEGTQSITEIVQSGKSSYNQIAKDHILDMKKGAIKDYLIGNADGNTNNYLIDGKKMFSIDNSMAGQKGNTGYITDLIDVTRKEGDTPKSWFEREFGIFKKEVDGLDMNNIPPKQREFISGKIDNFDENFIGKVQRILGGIR